MSARVGRQPLHAPRAPKGGDIEAMMKYVQEQKEKPSEALANATKLKKISNESKQRAKHAEHSKLFMDEFRKLCSDSRIAQESATNSFLNLSITLSNFPDLLKIDAKLKSSTGEAFAKCQGLKDRLDSIFNRKKDPQSQMMYEEVHNEYKEFLSSLEFPEEYDNIVQNVQLTKLPPPVEHKEMDIFDLNDEWQEKINEQISAFDTVENEMRKDYQKWLLDNKFNPNETCGGWNPFEHQRFLLTKYGQGIEFEKKSGEELARHKAWTIRTKFLSKKIKALHTELRKRVQEMRSQAIEDMKLKEKARLDEEMAEERREQLAEEKQALNSRLEIERAEKQERDSKKQQEEAEKKRIADEEAAKQKAKYEQEKAVLKKKVNMEKEKRSAIETRNRQRKLEQEERERKEQILLQKERKVAVAKRTQLLIEKQKAKEEMKKEAEKQDDNREKRLNALAQQVRDQFGLDNLEADPTKLTKIQIMRRNAEKEAKPMFNPTSFASSVIESDPRIKVEAALREAGLMNSPYAQQVIQQMSALRPTPVAGQSHFSLY